MTKKADSKPALEEDVQIIENIEDIVVNDPIEVVEESQNPKSEKLYSLDEIEKIIEQKLQKIQSTPQTQSEPTQIVVKSGKELNLDDLPQIRNWESRDRYYEALIDKKALSLEIRSKHKNKSPLQYFNPEKNTQHALRYATNESSFFIENQSNNAISTHIVMRNGMLFVPANEVNLQKFLAIHPDNGVVFKEVDERAEARKRTQELDFHFSVNKKVRELEYAKQKAIARLVCRSYNESWSPEQIIDELRYEANTNPHKVAVYIDDPEIEIKAVGKSAVAKGLILFDEYKFSKPNKEVIITVPIGNDPWDVFASWAKSENGRIYYDYLKAQF